MKSTTVAIAVVAFGVGAVSGAVLSRMAAGSSASADAQPPASPETPPGSWLTGTTNQRLAQRFTQLEDEARRGGIPLPDLATKERLGLS